VVHLEGHFGGEFYWARPAGKVIAWTQFASVLQRQLDCRYERRLAVDVCLDGLAHLAIVRRQRSGWEVVQELEEEMVQRS
jgi:hypothetical protein